MKFRQFLTFKISSPADVKFVALNPATAKVTIEEGTSEPMLLTM